MCAKTIFRGESMYQQEESVCVATRRFELNVDLLNLI